MNARLATRCPNCRTAFRVTPDQLAAMGGQVRCGRCSFVFNAVDHLLPPATEGVTQMPPIAPPPKPAAPLQPTPAHPAPGHASPTHSVPSHPVTPPAGMPPFTPPLIAPSPPSEPPRPQPAPAPAPFDLANLLVPPPKPRSRWWWGLLSVPLVLLMLAQAAWWWRDPLYRAWPASRPWWPEVCSRLHCTAPLPHDKQALLVDNVALEEVSTSPHVVRWSAELHNTADYPVALPALELTLTDVHDQAVVRKVFRPGEYAPDASSTLPAGATLSIRRILGLSVAGASGYRVLAFYP